MNTQEIVVFLTSLKSMLQNNNKNVNNEWLIKSKPEYKRIITTLSPRQQDLFHAILYSLLGAKNYEDLFAYVNLNGKKHLVHLETFEQKRSLDPHYTQIVYLAELAHTFEKLGNFKEQAKKLSLMCETLDDSLAYLNNFYFSKKQTTKTFDKACSMICPLQDTNHWDVKTWRGISKQNHWKHLIEDMDFNQYILPAAINIEASLKKAARTSSLPFKELAESKRLNEAWARFVNKIDNPNKKLASQCFQKFLIECPTNLLMQEYYKTLYQDADKNLKAAKLFKEYDYSQYAFNAYLKFIPQDGDAIPDVVVDETDLGVPTGYYIQKLPPTDPRAALLGDLTNCCQHILHEDGGSMCEYGITGINGGFYVLCKRLGEKRDLNTDTIVSQSLVLRNGKDLLFCCVTGLAEMREGYAKNSRFKNIDIWAALYCKLAQKIVSNPSYGITKVMAGNTMGSIFISKYLGLSGAGLLKYINRPDDYHGRSADFMHQDVLAIRDIPLFDFFILIHDALFTEEDRNNASRNLKKYIDSDSGFETICELLKNADSNAYTFAVICELEHLFKEMSIDKDQNATLAKKQQLFITIVNNKFPNKDEPLRRLVDSEKYLRWWMEKYKIPADITVNFTGMRCPLIHLAAANNVEILQYFLDQLGDKAVTQLSQKNNLGMNPLEKAITFQQIAMAQFLINAGCDLYQKNWNGESVLYLAAERARGYGAYNNNRAQKHWDVVKSLLEKGGSNWEKFYPGVFNQVLHKAMFTGKDVVKILLFKRWISFKDLSNDDVTYLVTNQHLDAQNDQGDTLMHMYLTDLIHAQDNTTRANSLDTIKWLIKLDINLSLQNMNGDTPLHLLAISNQWDLMKKIPSYQNHCLDIRNNSGNTVLHIVAKYKQWELLKYLIEQGASFDVKNNNEETVWDVVKNEPKVFEWLQQRESIILDSAKATSTARIAKKLALKAENLQHPCDFELSTPGDDSIQSKCFPTQNIKKTKTAVLCKLG